MQALISKPSRSSSSLASIKHCYGKLWITTSSVNEFSYLKRSIECRKKGVIQHVEDFSFCTGSMYLHVNDNAKFELHSFSFRYSEKYYILNPYLVAIEHNTLIHGLHGIKLVGPTKLHQVYAANTNNQISHLQ